MGDEDDETYECPVDECERTFDTRKGRGVHCGRSHDQRELIKKAIRDLAEELNRTPTANDASNSNKTGLTAVNNHFGSWNEALKAAGLDTNLEMVSEISNEDLLSELERLSEQISRTPRKQDMVELGEYSCTPYQEAFGSWNDALKKAGLDVNRKTSVSEDDIIKSIKELANELGRPPTSAEMCEYGTLTKSHVRRVFGSWNEGLKEAGYETHIDLYITKKEVIDQIQDMYDDLGRTPTINDLEDADCFSLPVVIRHFGTWNNALREAGVEINEKHEHTKEHVLSAIRELADDLGRTPTATDMRELGSVSIKSAQNHFGTWNNALREAGLEINRVYKKTGEPTRIYYGPNWISQKRPQIQSRDNNSCRVCKTHSTNIDEYSVHVHHIKPAREFGAHDPDVDTDYEKMNDPSNLICLCPSCHGQLEGKFQDADPDEFAELGREHLGIDVEAEINTTQDTTDDSVQTELPAASD